MDSSNLDMLAMMAFLRDAPAIGIHVPGRPDINGAELQRGIRFMFNRVPTYLTPLEPIATPAPVKVKAVKVTRAKKGGVPGSAGQWVAAVRTVLRAADTRNGGIPILACVRITVKDGVATLTSTDMERWITYTLATAAPDMDCVTNGKALLAALKAMPTDTVVELVKHADTPDTQVTVPAVEAGPWRPAVPEHVKTVPDVPGALQIGRSKLGCMVLADYPSLALGELPHSFELTTEDATMLLGTVEHAISTEETRYYLNGIYLHTADGRLRAVTTDGHRLAMQKIGLPQGAETMPGIIIPRPTVADLLAILQPDQAVYVKLSDTRVTFECGPFKLVSKLIDGAYPEYERVIPSEKHCEHTVTLDRDSFAAAIKAGQAIGRDRSRPVKVTACATEGTVIVSAADPESGSYTSDPVSLPYGCSVDIAVGYQSRYLLDIIGAMQGSVMFQWSDSNSPCRILDTENPDALFVLMPMRI
jgi:DNA polymerase-3 subunit beta